MNEPNDLLVSLKELKRSATYLREDIDRVTLLTSRNWLFVLLLNPGIWALTQYRVSHWIHYYFHIPVIRPLLKSVCYLWRRIIQIMTGAEIPNRAIIGKGLYLPHTNGIVIHIDAVIGDYCDVMQQVTIGTSLRGSLQGTPKIGDRVFIGPGAKVFGDIYIGNSAAIGANAVVNKSVPNNAVVVGIPAKVVSYSGTSDFIKLCPENTN